MKWIKLFVHVLKRGSYKSFEKRMWLVLALLEFRMSLGSDEPWMIWNLDHLNDVSVR